MRDIIINDVKFKDIPESLEDITIKQYEDIFLLITEDMNYIEQQAIAVSGIYNIPLNEVYNIHGEVFSAMVDEILFIFETYNGETRNTVTIDKTDYYIPNVGDMSLRQYIDIEETVKDKHFSYTELLSVLLVKIGGDYKKLDLDIIESLPVSVLLPLMYHFFRLGKSMNQLTVAYSKLMQNPKLQDILNSQENITG